MKIRLIAAIIIGAAVIGAGHVKATCWDDVYNGQTNTEASIYAAYTSACLAADAERANNAAFDWVDYNFSVTMGDSVWVAYENAAINLAAFVQYCNMTNYNALPNPSCTDTADYNLAQASVGVSLNYTIALAEAERIKNDAFALNVLNNFDGGLWNLDNIYSKEVGTALAAMDRSLTLEGDTVSVQYDACALADANAGLAADCAAFPDHCCADGCEQAYNTAKHAVFVDYMTQIRALADDEYIIQMAGVIRDWKDSEAQRNCQWDTDMANINYNHDLALFSAVRDFQLQEDPIVAAYDTAICICQGTDCALAAAIQSALNDAGAQMAFNANASLLGQVLTLDLQMSQDTLTANLDADSDEYDETVREQNDDMNAISIAAGASSAAGYAAAAVAYAACLAHCE